MVQHFASILCDQDKIFDPDADSFLLEIDARLNGKDLSGLYDALIDGRDVSGLMVLNSDGMSCSVGEEFPVSLFCNITAAGVVHITHSGAWPGGIDSSLLGFPDNLVDFSGFLRNFTEKDGSRHIRAVVVPDTADVQHNTVSPLSKGGIRGVVRIFRRIFRKR